MIEADKQYNLIIIGAGPAGLTAAIYAKRALIKVLILEKELGGGKLNKTKEVENYPGFIKIGGMELAEKIMQHANQYNLKWQQQEVLELKKYKDMFEVKTNKDTFYSQTIIIASGTIEKTLGVKGEKEFTNFGVSCCAICDGFAFKNQKVAVVGGGYSACESALYLSNIADKVYLIHRRQEFRVEEEIIRQIKTNPKIELVLDAEIVEIFGQETVQAKKITHLSLNLVNQTTKIINVTGVFPCIGLKPLVNFSHEKICSKQGYIITDNYCATEILGLFAAGDVTKPIRIKQIVTAVADGAIAAQSVIKYLKSKKNS